MPPSSAGDPARSASLAPGTRLGAFEVVSLLGAGGMGQVYRARDTRLDRFVAVKVLLPSAADRPGRPERFEREAKAISRLSHPHICALYDVGEAALAPAGPAATAGAIRFLVMECLEGETLARRLAGGALQVDEALMAGVQIADALDAAHRHGVVHRDLKPSNIMMTSSGVKL